MLEFGWAKSHDVSTTNPLDFSVGTWTDSRIESKRWSHPPMKPTDETVSLSPKWPHLSVHLIRVFLPDGEYTERVFRGRRKS